MIWVYFFLDIKMTIDYYYMDGSPPCAVVTLTVAALGIESQVQTHRVDEMNDEHLKEDYLKVFIVTKYNNKSIINNRRPLLKYFVCLNCVLLHDLCSYSR